MTTVKSRMQAGRTVCALAVDSASPAVVEMAGGLGFSAVVLDARHGALSPFSAELEHLVRAAAAASIPALVRAPESTAGTLNRCLNDGADGVIVPAVRGVQDAEAASAATRYPPLGRRGAAPVVRSARFGLQDWDEYVAETNDHRLVLCSLETWDDVAGAGAVCGVDGVDGVVFDLPTLALAGDRRPPGPDDPRLAAARAACATAGGMSAVVTADHEAALAWARAGVQLVVLHGDLLAAAARATELRRSLDAVPAQVGAVR